MRAPAVIETGIKAVDLVAPLVAGGSLAIGGSPGTGQAVLAMEIVNNLAVSRSCRTVFSVPDPELFRNGLREAAIEGDVLMGPAPGRVVLLEDGRPLASIVLGEVPDATSWIVLSRELLRAGQVPAVDLLRSGTRARLPAPHRRAATRARKAVVDQRAGLLLAFLRQWFKVGEPWTGQPAEYSTLDQTLAGAERLLPR